jgi:Zn-finger nucleic acid-binding protein
MRPGVTTAIAGLMQSYKRTKLEKKLKRRLTPEEEEKYYYAEIRKKAAEIERQIKDEVLDESIRGCPECLRSFSILHIDDVEIDFCEYCKSLWFDLKELMTLTQLSQEALEHEIEKSDEKSIYRCPICNKELEVYNYKHGKKTKIDVCINDGFYLESKELKRNFG